MAEEFEGDLRDAVFWGADLKGATFRDVDLTGVSISHARIVDVDIDGLVDRVTINGVDVTQFVNEHDRWFPLRAMLRPPDPAGMRAAWTALEQAWAGTLARAQGLTEAQRNESVDGEWSVVETLRHLQFAIDKWCTVPLLGDATFHPIGLPNSGSAGGDWPGLDRDARPTFDDALAVRAGTAARFVAYLDTVTPDDLDQEVDVLENGVVPVHECIFTVFEEEFEHHRYAERDLDSLAEPNAST